MLDWLLVLVPVSVVLGYVVHAPAPWVFATAAGAIVPLADWMRRATEQVARTAGPAVGGLLNISFGNMAELVLALFVLRAGRPDVVKAQITGSFIGNGLLGLGLAIVVGGWGRAKQTFTRAQGGLLGSMLILATIALLLPALFDYTERDLLRAPNPGTLDERLSLGVSVVLIAAYGLNLVYTLVTHRDLFSGCHDAPVAPAGRGPAWPLGRALAVLAAGTALTALEAELVAGALEHTAAALGLTAFFLGVTVLAVIGNASEYLAAIYFARRDRMGLVISITAGSSIQIALLTAPLLVLASYALGTPMNLVFANPLELIAIAGVAFAVHAISQDGETTWFEGVLLLTVWALLALAFFFVTPAPASAAARARGL
ncbi:MAG TPA: calcium/proton exchanger [Gemmatimonadales bacterium]|nr:calcium/proton exchanger [Gemmatimonadales bacterium]